MKKTRTFLVTAIFGLFAMLQISNAQNTATVTWNLSATDSMKVSLTTGNIVGQAESIGAGPNGMVVRDYYTDRGQRLNQGSFGWVKEASQDDTRYIEFIAAPTAGFDLTVTNVSFNYGFAGSTNSMNSNVYYSLDNWKTRTRMNEDVGNLVYGNSTGAQYAKTLTVLVPNGQKFSVRIYPFWVGNTTASTSKYAVHNTFVITGLTTTAGSTVPLTIKTSPISVITYKSAICGGNVISDGGSAVTARGVCWNTTGSPTISDSKTSDGSGTGIFISTLSGLNAKTKYYARAYATNSTGTSYGDEVTFTTLDPPIIAFPGAEGFGKYTVGGRGGKVIEVINLNDSGAGSLREAVSQSGPRTIIFRVSGTITLNSNLDINNPYITIAGQTAPGDGICIKKYSLNVNTYQVIIRYLRVRLGDETGGESDAMGGRYQRSIIIDHCSVSWSEDETLSPYWNDSLTVQWCIVSESLYNSNHPKGSHGYGGIWGGNHSTYHHNLLAHHSSRNPRFASGCGLNDFRNNVIYNWGFNSMYGGEYRDTNYTGSLPSNINVVANYYKYGPGTRSGILYKIAGPSSRNLAADCGRWFIDGNYVYGSATVTANNWNGGILPDAGITQSMIKADQPFDVVAINQQTPQDAYESVLKYAGAILPKRDAVDTRIVGEVRNGNATFEGKTYSSDRGLHPTGIIDSQIDVGGWPVLNSTTPPLDTDHDGMPDNYESANGLNPNDPNDANTKNSNGYTMLEVYLNYLVDTLTGVEEKKEQIPVNFTLSQNYPNPFNPSTKIQYSLPKESKVKLEVFDILGRNVITLVDGLKSAGTYNVDFSGSNLSSGVYIYRLTTTDKILSMKMLLMK